jgi:ABC-type branched-subunit amino acid transport system ATPase component
VVGTVPLVLLFDLLTASFPNYFSILLGVIFLLIVYALPDGVAGLLSGGLARWRTRRPRERVEHVPQKSPPVWRARTCSEKGIERDDNAKKSHPGLAAGLRNFWPAAKPARALAAFGANGGPILAIDGLRKSFGGLVAVDHLDLFVRKGEILGLIGPNGSGKTTALNLISGALRSDAGEIRLHGQPIERLSPARIARLGVARTFQLVRVLGSMTCLDNVVTGTAFRSSPLWGEAARQTAMSLLARVGLADKAPVPASQLTYIDQKRLELARALALGPDLLLLDEWLAGLNPSELKDGIALIQSLRDEGLSILIVEHVMDAIRALCDRCVVMSAGRKIAEGAPAAVLSDREVVRAYLGEADA